MGSKKVQERHNQVNFSFIEYINTLSDCMCVEMRGAGRTVLVFLSLIILSTGLSAAYAQDASQIPPLSISTELPLYDQGDSVIFSGKVKTLVENNLQDITLRVIGPLVNGTSSNIVQIKQITPQLDGSYEGNFVVSGPLWQKKGDYKIVVNYGAQKAETMFFYNGGTGQSDVDVPPPPPPPECGEGEVLKDNQCVPFVEEPKCGVGTVLDPVTGTCVVEQGVECPPGETLVNGQCVPKEPTGEDTGPICGAGTHAENGICVPDKKPATGGPGCLIATAAFGTELAPQVQLLREVRDNVVFGTSSGTAFMGTFNTIYYSFSPTVADWERQSPLFKEVVKTAITPMLSTLSILNYVDIDSEQDMLAYGIGIMLLNVGMYLVAPALVVVKVRSLIKKRL